MRTLPLRLVTAALVVGLALAAPPARAQQASSDEFAARQYESGLAFLREQKFGEALRDFQTVVDNYPASRVADAALLQIALYHLDRARDLAAAQTAIDALLKKYPTSESAPMGHVLAGRLLTARSRAKADIDAALSNFERVPRLYPGSDAVPAAHYQAAETMRLTHEDGEAIQRYRLVSIDFPRSIWAARALMGEARCLVNTGKPVQAMELLQRVRQRFPGTPEAASALAWNTTLYRLYVRPPAQPAYQFSNRTLVGRNGKLEDIDVVRVDPRGTIFAAGDTVVVPFDASGRMQPAASLTKPVAIAFDRAGEPLFVLKAGLLSGRKAYGLSVPKQDGSPRLLEDVTAGVVSSFGDLLLADKDTKAIGKFSLTGNYAGPFAPVNCLRLALDDTDRIAALEQEGGAIALLEGDGRVRAKIPARGQGYEFDKVVDIAFDVFGHLYVLDRGLGAVHVFLVQQQPRLVTTFTAAGSAAGALKKGRAFGLDAAARLYVYDEDAKRIQIYQ